MLSFPLSNLSQLPFWERKGPFPVANFSFSRKGSFPGKGTVPKIAETFPSCRGSFPGKGKDLSQLQPFLGKDLSLKWVQNNYSLKNWWLTENLSCLNFAVSIGNIHMYINNGWHDLKWLWFDFINNFEMFFKIYETRTVLCQIHSVLFYKERVLKILGELRNQYSNFGR